MKKVLELESKLKQIETTQKLQDSLFRLKDEEN